MASIALHRGTLLAMTVHASNHGDRFFLCDYVAFSDRPMANIASDLGLRVMDAMREVYEIRKLVDLHPRDRLLLFVILSQLVDRWTFCSDGCMARHTLRFGGVANILLCRNLMAIVALLHKLGVQLVAKRDGLRLCSGHGFRYLLVLAPDPGAKKCCSQDRKRSGSPRVFSRYDREDSLHGHPRLVLLRYVKVDGFVCELRCHNTRTLRSR